MQVVRMKVAPDTVAYADREHHKLIVEFAIPGAPTETIDAKILEDSVHLLAPVRDINYVSALALGWPGADLPAFFGPAIAGEGRQLTRSLT